MAVTMRAAPPRTQTRTIHQTLHLELLIWNVACRRVEDVVWVLACTDLQDLVGFAPMRVTDATVAHGEDTRLIFDEPLFSIV